MVFPSQALISVKVGLAIRGEKQVYKVVLITITRSSGSRFIGLKGFIVFICWFKGFKRFTGFKGFKVLIEFKCSKGSKGF